MAHAEFGQELPVPSSSFSPSLPSPPFICDLLPLLPPLGGNDENGGFPPNVNDDYMRRQLGLYVMRLTSLASFLCVCAAWVDPNSS